MSIQVARWDVGRGAETGGKAGDGGCDSAGIRVTPRVCGMRLRMVRAAMRVWGAGRSFGSWCGK
ncbi:hypothetical protein MKY19_20625 [Paenibacillus sp. FSL R5-0744]|uniref:hypothetical protein n=1 Tax=unclassified Paenibacillus TaxID=185978 RepID=UPI0030D73ADB